MANKVGLLTVLKKTSSSITLQVGTQKDLLFIDVYCYLNGSLIETQTVDPGTQITFSGLNANTTYTFKHTAQFLTHSLSLGTLTETTAQNSIQQLDCSITDVSAGTDYISFRVFVEPLPENLYEYDYFVYLKGEDDEEYWQFDFIGYDPAPRLDEEIKLKYGIDPNTSYKIYVEVWYCEKIVGTTPKKSITTSKETLSSSCSITSIKRTGAQLAISIKNTGHTDYYFAIHGSTTLPSRFSVLHSAVIISSNTTYVFSINLTDDDKNKPLYIYIDQFAVDFSSETVYPDSGGIIYVGGKAYTCLHSSDSYNTAYPIYNVFQIPAPITYSVTFNHYDANFNEIATSTTYEIGEEEVITLSTYQKAIDGYEYFYALDSEVVEVSSALIVENTWFDLIYKKKVTITAWSWETSNGSASESKTKAAHTALTNNGLVSDFSFLVWNDIVDKVKEILDFVGAEWNNKYATYSGTKMYKNTETDQTGQMLTMLRFNSLRENVDNLYETGISQVKTNDTVYGVYFIVLTDSINQYLKNIK